MASEDGGGEMLGDQRGGVEVESRSAPGATDDLRARMRLRLAMTQSARSDASSTPAVATDSADLQRGYDHASNTTWPTVDGDGSGSNAGGSNAGGSSAGHVPDNGAAGVGPLVWNSVLDTLSSSLSAAAAAAAANDEAHGHQPTAQLSGQPALQPAYQPSSLAAVFAAEPIHSAHVTAGSGLAALATPPGGQRVVQGANVIVDPAGAVVESVAATAVAPAMPAVEVPVAVVAPTPAVPTVPAVASSAIPEMIVPSIPVLSQPSRAAAPPRATTTGREEGATPVVGAAGGKAKKKRRPFRALLSFLLVMSLIGGAAFAGWYFLIRPKVTWPADVKPLADFVEKTVRKDFTEKVDIVALSAPEYEVKLGIELLAGAYPSTDGGLDALAAVGLAGQVPTPSVVGHWAAASMTSFYRPSDETIYRMDGSTAVFQVAMLRSLTLALADQELDTTKQMAGLSDAARVGYQGLLNGVAAQVVAAQYLANPSLKTQNAVESAVRHDQAGLSAGIPIYVATALASVEFGATRYPVAPATNLLANVAVPPVDDAGIFDLTHDPAMSVAVPEPAVATATTVADPAAVAVTTVAPVVVATVDPAAASTTVVAAAAPASAAPVGPSVRTLGMQFWFMAMQPTLGSSAARTAAQLWIGDAAMITTADQRSCLDANIRTASPEAQAALFAALDQVARSRPGSSEGQVVPQADNLLKVRMCETVEPTADPVAAADIGQLYSSAAAEAVLATDLLALGLPDTLTAWSCAIQAHRNGQLATYVLGSTAPELVTEMQAVITACAS